MYSRPGGLGDPDGGICSVKLLVCVEVDELEGLLGDAANGSDIDMAGDIEADDAFTSLKLPESACGGAGVATSPVTEHQAQLEDLKPSIRLSLFECAMFEQRTSCRRVQVAAGSRQSPIQHHSHRHRHAVLAVCLWQMMPCIVIPKKAANKNNDHAELFGQFADKDRDVFFALL